MEFENVNGEWTLENVKVGIKMDLHNRLPDNNTNLSKNYVGNRSLRICVKIIQKTQIAIQIFFRRKKMVLDVERQSQREEREREKEDLKYHTHLAVWYIRR